MENNLTLLTEENMELNIQFKKVETYYGSSP